MNITQIVYERKQLRVVARTLDAYLVSILLTVTVVFVALAQRGFSALGSLVFPILFGVAVYVLRRKIEDASVVATGLLAAVLLLLVVSVSTGAFLTPKASPVTLASILALLLFFTAPCYVTARACLAATRMRRLRTTAREMTEAMAEVRRRHHRHPHAAHRPIRSIVSFAIAMTLYGLCALVCVLIATANIWIAALVFAILCTVPARFYERGQRQSAVAAAELRRLDVRAPVLYLRSFANDRVFVKPTFRWTNYVHGLRKWFTLENLLVDSLWCYGPVVAIGRPGDRLPQYGAARDYVSDEVWQERVERYLSECGFVVILVGNGEGLKWEYERIVSHGLMSKTLLVFPPMPREAAQTLWNAFAERWPCAAPLDPPAEKCDRYLLAAIAPADGSQEVITCRYNGEEAYRLAIAILSRRLAAVPVAASRIKQPSPSVLTLRMGY